MMQRQCLVAFGLMAILGIGFAHAADPVDTILYTEGGTNAGLWRLAHTETPPGSFYNAERHTDRGGAVLFNNVNALPQPNLPLMGDVNGDGLADMVRVANDGLNELFVASHSYDPTFFSGYGVLNTLGTDDSWIGVPFSAFKYFLGDIDGDGRDDAIALRDGGWEIFPGGPNATVWEAYLSSASGLGNNGFSYSVVSSTADEHFVGDFNGDGQTDIGRRVGPGMVDPQGWLFTYTSGPSGLVEPATVSDIIQGAVNIDNEDTHVTTLIGDINGDGLDDVIEVDDRFEDGNWVFVCGLTAPSGAPSGYDLAAGGISWASPFDAPPTGLTRQFARIGDMNGDGYEDLVMYREYTDGGFSFGQWLVSHTDPGTGDLMNSVLSEAVEIRHETGVNDGCIPLLAQVGPPIPAEDCSNGLDDDFDFLVDCNDPHCFYSPDCLCYGPEDDTVLYNIDGAVGGGYWFLSHTYCAANQPPFYNGNPQESLAYFNDPAMVPNPNIPLVGDVNGDGFDDIVRVGDNGAQEVFVATNTYDSGYGVGMLGSGFPDSFVGYGQICDAFFLGDVNSDGYVDPIAAQPNDNPGIEGGDPNVLVWNCYHAGPGGFGLNAFSWVAFGRTQFPSGGGATLSPTTLLVGDFNGDGRQDVGYRRPSDADAVPGFILCALSGPNGLTNVVSVNDIVQGFVANEANHIATLVGDINGDGLADIVEVDDRGSTGQWNWVAGLTGPAAEPSGLGIGAGGISWTFPFAPAIDQTFAVPLLADINGDGFDDIVVYREFLQMHEFGDTVGQWVVAYTDPNTGNLFNSTFSDAGTLLIPTGFEGNYPLVGTFDLPDCSGLPADLDKDGDVDLTDIKQLQMCFTGDGDPLGLFADLSFRCRCLDTGDGDIDIEELGVVDGCMNGPDVAPACP